MIEFKSKIYFLSLLIINAILAVYNLFTLIFLSSIIAVIPLCLQLPIIYFAITKDELVIIFIKIWSFIILIGGVAGWISIFMVLTIRSLGEVESISLLKILLSTVQIGFPIYFLINIKNIIIVEETADANQVVNNDQDKDENHDFPEN